MQVAVDNPRGRVPVSLILDDSCPVLNLTRPWIRDCWVTAPPHRGVTPRIPWHRLPAEIPADFAREFADWAEEQGVKGKFSVVPMPAGIGRIDEGLPGVEPRKLREWLDVLRDRLHPRFDLTPEMITHTYAVDLKTWRLLPEMEQYEWTEGQSAETLAEYQAAALEILRNVGIEAEGVTSPGGYGCRVMDAYARATLEASKSVTGRRVTFFFSEVEKTPRPPRVLICRPEEGEAMVSVIACTDDWFGGWTGWDLGDPDLCITEDLQSGRLVEWIRAGQPAVICSHWPGFPFHDESGRGFAVCRAVVDRLNRLPNVLWMKTSEIARYWAARAMVDLAVDGGEVIVTCPIECPDFTLRVEDAPEGKVWLEGRELPEAPSAAALRPGTWHREAGSTRVCLDLPAGGARLRFGLPPTAAA